MGACRETDFGGQEGGRPPSPEGGITGISGDTFQVGTSIPYLHIGTETSGVLISLHALILLDLISEAPCLFILADGMAWADDGQMSVGARGQVSAFGAVGENLRKSVQVEDFRTHPLFHAVEGILGDFNMTLMYNITKFQYVHCAHARFGIYSPLNMCMCCTSSDQQLY